MSIYIYSVNFISEKLFPPSLRGTKQLAWIKTILKPIQNLWQRIFVDYVSGSLHAEYNIASAYVITNRVIWSNKRVYECILNAGAGIEPSDTTYWVLINDNFIGASERVKYNAQKMVFEYALNKYFRVFTSPLIYINNNFVAADLVFVMGLTGDSSSDMPLNSSEQLEYMGLVPSYATSIYDYTIYVPLAVFLTLGTTTTNRENAVRQFADKYNLSGMKYSVVTY